MTGAEIVIETLLEQGTDTVFGYPGATVIDIYDKLEMHKDRITHILAAHEQGRRIRKGNGQAGRSHRHFRPRRDKPCNGSGDSFPGFGSDGSDHG